MSIFFFLLSRIYMLSIKMATEMFLFVFSLILIAIFLPFRQADLTASAATSTCE